MAAAASLNSWRRAVIGKQLFVFVALRIAPFFAGWGLLIHDLDEMTISGFYNLPLPFIYYFSKSASAKQLEIH
jgi:hypothetical protein